MGSRHEARLWAIQFLFQCDFNREDRVRALEDFWYEKEPTDREKSFMEELVSGVEDHRAELDERLQKYAEHWDVARMGAVDRNVLRVALYEMLFCPDIPPVVSINEAVDLAKALSSQESGRFVNGILDRALRDIGRPPRESSRT
jgi:N utilization substance protein B